ncbi:GTP 3',8-cyclase MoaA [Peptoclostridium litorale]|uniref:GTP 3',8-cyclase MoaA n=1 Tax=Peptoclostridium litorale TaxID=1557 RepID=UPI00056F37F6|nr:GTP 3',8-cyclase MoaA [Peptoclostridium litorale]
MESNNTLTDGCGRKINYLRISVTDLCNLRCKYCMPKEGVSKLSHEKIMSIEEMAQISRILAGIGIDKIRITGGEPLVKKGITRLISEIAQNANVKDIAMTTNGILLRKYAKKLREAGLKRVNISLDTLDARKYSQITRGGDLLQVLDGIEQAKRAGLSPIKINTVLIGGFNDDEIEDFVRMTMEEEIDVRFIELMPIGQAAGWSSKNFISNRAVLEKFPGLKKCNPSDKSSPAEYYRLEGAKGKVGLINPISCKFCDDCNRIRLTSDGKLKLCLHSDYEIDIINPFRRGEDIKEIVVNELSKKPKSHHLEDGDIIKRNMVQIGG